MNVPNQNPIARFSQALGNFVPDAISASVFLLAVVVAAALSIGNSSTAVIDAYYRGLWMLLPFTMQMTLILVMSAVVSTTPLFRRAVVVLAELPERLRRSSRWPWGSAPRSATSTGASASP